MPEDISESASDTDTASPQNPPTPKAAQYVLPKDIANSVRHLSDRDLENLLEACAKESKRRGPKNAPQRSVPIGAAPVPLTRAQVGAVQAAFKAGVKPVAIARQFRLSHARVREALSLKAT